MAFRRCSQLCQLVVWAALGAARSDVALSAGPDQPCPPVGDVELHAQLWPFGPDGDFWEITIRPDGTRDIKVLYGLQTGPGEITGKFSYSPENFHSLDAVLDSTQYFELP